jgi:hypothetical protein
MLSLSRSDPLFPEFPSFILDVLEVVDSPTESSKYVHIRNEQKLDAPICKPEGSVLSGPTAVSGAARLRRGAPPPAKRHLDSGNT